MATTYNEDGSKGVRKNEKPCPSGFYRDKKTGKYVQAVIGPEYKP